MSKESNSIKNNIYNCILNFSQKLFTEIPSFFDFLVQIFSSFLQATLNQILVLILFFLPLLLFIFDSLAVQAADCKETAASYQVMKLY